MGCDIHTYLEYSTWETKDDGPYWQCYGGRWNPGRDYDMFGLLAGARGGIPVFQPKGLPEGKMAYQTEADAYLRITDDPTQFDWDGYCSRTSAESWANHGCRIEKINEHYERIDHPDWHSHSWLTPDEYAQVLGKYMLEYRDAPGVEYDVLLVTMRAFEERGAKARLVFWFDN